MTRIATLTLNPTVDSSCEAERVAPMTKVRTKAQRFDPGGGGINVARVLDRLGEKVDAIYLAGSVSGDLLESLLVDRGIRQTRLPIAGPTRMSIAVFERATGQEYRFVPEGPVVTEAEWQAAIDHCAAQDVSWLIASGSLPRGIPTDFYARLARACAHEGRKLVLDTSGPALAEAMEAGGYHVVKANQEEFEELLGHKLPDIDAIKSAAHDCVHSGMVEMLAISLAEQGGVLATCEGVIHMPAPQVEVHSATGAGDSVVAGMVHGLLRGESPESVLCWGIAAGAAAVLTPGTDLCQAEDVLRLRAEMC